MEDLLMLQRALTASPSSIPDATAAAINESILSLTKSVPFLVPAPYWPASVGAAVSTTKEDGSREHTKEKAALTAILKRTAVSTKEEDSAP